VHHRENFQFFFQNQTLGVISSGHHEFTSMPRNSLQPDEPRCPLHVVIELRACRHHTFKGWHINKKKGVMCFRSLSLFMKFSHKTKDPHVTPRVLSTNKPSHYSIIGKTLLISEKLISSREHSIFLPNFLFWDSENRKGPRSGFFKV